MSKTALKKKPRGFTIADCNFDGTPRCFHCGEAFIASTPVKVDKKLGHRYMPQLWMLDSIPEDRMKRRLKPETLLRRFKTCCILASCRKRIPMKRQRRRAITCKPEHQALLTKMRKIERDHRQCSVCGRPSSPGERVEFRRWRVSKVQGHRKKTVKASKGILTPAEANQKLSEIAYVVVERPKRTPRNKARKGAAA